MKASKAKKLTDFTLSEKIKKQELKKSLQSVFDKIFDQTEKGSYVLSIDLDTLSLSQQSYLKNIGYTLNFKTKDSNFLGSYISWR